MCRSCVLEAGTSNHIKKHENHRTFVLYLRSHILYTLVAVLLKGVRISHMRTCPLLAVYFVTHKMYTLAVRRSKKMTSMRNANKHVYVNRVH